MSQLFVFSNFEWNNIWLDTIEYTFFQFSLNIIIESGLNIRSKPRELCSLELRAQNLKNAELKDRGDERDVRQVGLYFAINIMNWLAFDLLASTVY